MTEEQLVSSALKFGIKVYPISKYYKNISTAPKNSVIIGYSSVLIDNIEYDKETKLITLKVK